MKLLAASFCLTFLGMSAFAQAPTSGPGGTTDQDFITLAAQSDMTEANLGQLAQTAATSDDVKTYAQMLVTEHTADYTKLGTLASKAGLTVPKALDAKQNKMIAPYAKLKGTAFDRKYLHDMVASHEAAIAAYNKQARDGQNAEIKAYAQATIANLEKHESSAKDLMKSGGKKAAQ
jgi:putative membrane protein